MKREIKFRAYHKERKEIFEIASIDFEEKKAALSNGIIKLLNVNFKQFELLQYTGAKDKNGKEIYEGDVVKLVHFKDGRKKETGKVIFLHSQAGFGIIDRDGNEYPLFRNTAKQIEIIENIQENKR
ncbi:YopX family protein [Leptotrichia massiliensis]|uniref:YopX family protein n=1 Tax=Leptotrichia massiliensis TaxID=1852388 RepID=UPI0028D60B55|nr:YopX family protein [Leptotrichia massiliensis]